MPEADGVDGHRLQGERVGVVQQDVAQQLVQVTAGQRGRAGAVRPGLSALAGIEVHQHAADDEIRVGVEVGAAVERRPGGHRPRRQHRQQLFQREVTYRDQVGDLVGVGQREQVRRAAVASQPHQAGPVDRGRPVQLHQQRERVAAPCPPLVRDRRTASGQSGRAPYPRRRSRPGICAAPSRPAHGARATAARRAPGRPTAPGRQRNRSHQSIAAPWVPATAADRQHRRAGPAASRYAACRSL